MTAVKKTHRITLIPGDGIGPEVSGAVVKILEAAGAATGVAFEWHPYAAGAEAFEKTGEYIPKALYDSIEREPGGAEGAGDDADWRRVCFDQRDAAEEVRAVRELSAGEESAGVEDELSGHRSDDRAREHGGSVRGPGA